ncbi:hypothetical protein [Psychrobacter sp. DAB_AL32B]|uniref:hypothetical protein n=1 Tax=Psychrobacter sp. DAB_AL32B TaxID=1028414 RepID=UPI000B7F9DB9|nr:hypothetical protein [Psychrobacter sp. DAB_AL32B]OXL24797.1 hypothetical protein CAN34_05080 [Psychrobacter sp. DAB_AL32B]
MKKSLILICTLLCMHTAQARVPSEIQTQKDSINAPLQYPKELQELGLYIDSTLDAVKNISDKEDFCSNQTVFAFNIMEMRQNGVDYSDIYHLMNISNKADLTTKGMAKLDSYRGVFEEAYDYPIYNSKEDKGTATTFYMTYKNHQCLLSL